MRKRKLKKKKNTTSVKSVVFKSVHRTRSRMMKIMRSKGIGVLIPGGDRLAPTVAERRPLVSGEDRLVRTEPGGEIAPTSGL